MSLEPVFLFVESNLNWLNGFLLAGVILILVGVKNVTIKDLHTYKLSTHHRHKVDEMIAWGFFYIIFGFLIATGALLSAL